MTEYIALLIVFLLLSAFFSSSETAFFSIDAMRVETFLREGRAGAARVSALLSQPTRLLSAILLGNNLTNTAAAAVGTVIATQLAPGGPGLLAATLVVTALLVVFGEIGPKTVALEHNWVVARVYARPLALWARLARPVVAVLDRVSRAMLAVGGARTESPQSLTPGELRTAIHLGAEKGTVEEQASGVMLGALDLAERQVQTIMTHRTNVVAVEAAESVRAASRRLTENGYLRMPVYDAEPDNVVGFLHISEISAAAAAPHLDQQVRELMRRPLFEPTSASIGHVLERMKRDGAHMVTIVDEVGAFSGIVTLEDIMEELVGEIRSETGVEPGEQSRREGHHWVVEGARDLASLGSELGSNLSRPGVSTVAGLVLSEARRMPRVGETVVIGRHRFGVSQADERRIIEVTIERIDSPEPDAEMDEPAEDAGSRV